MLILNVFIIWFYKFGCDRIGEVFNLYVEIIGNSVLMVCCKEYGIWWIFV